MANVTSRQKRVSAAKALQLILDASDSEDDVSNDDASNDLSDEEFGESAVSIYNHYVSRMLPYTGKPASSTGNVAERQSPTSNVIELCRHILGSGRNLTIDRYYTNVEMAEDLVKNHNVTVVGTINSNRVHISEEMKSATGREVLSTKFAWCEKLMLLSYVPKPKKNVLLLSTQHDQPCISQRADRKPEVILAYNEGKGGVYTVDKMIDTYSPCSNLQQLQNMLAYLPTDTYCFVFNKAAKRLATSN